MSTEGKSELALDEKLPCGDWEPSEHQLSALEYVLERNCKFKIGAMTKEVGMGKNNWANWQKNENFITWWHKQLELHAHDRLLTVMAGLFEIAEGKKSGTRMQVSAAKLLMERYDKKYTQRSEVNVKGELKLGVGNAKLDLILDEVIARCAAISGGQRAIEEKPDQGDSARTSPVDESL